MKKKLTKIEFSPPLEIEEGETIVVNTNPPIKITGGSQLDQIERMLKYSIVKDDLREIDKNITGVQKMMPDPQLQPVSEVYQNALNHWMALRHQKEKQLPDISDIIEKKK